MKQKKSIVGLYYTIAGLWNKFVNQHKLEVGLYLMALGVTWNAIDAISSLEYSAYAKTVDKFRKKIKKEYILKIEQYFIKNVFFFQKTLSRTVHSATEKKNKNNFFLYFLYFSF